MSATQFTFTIHYSFIHPFSLSFCCSYTSFSLCFTPLQWLPFQLLLSVSTFHRSHITSLTRFFPSHSSTFIALLLFYFPILYLYVFVCYQSIIIDYHLFKEDGGTDRNSMFLDSASNRLSLKSSFISPLRKIPSLRKQNSVVAAASPKFSMRVASKQAYICRDCGYHSLSLLPFCIYIFLFLDPCKPLCSTNM